MTTVAVASVADGGMAPDGADVEVQGGVGCLLVLSSAQHDADDDDADGDDKDDDDENKGDDRL